MTLTKEFWEGNMGQHFLAKSTNFQIRNMLNWLTL